MDSESRLGAIFTDNDLDDVCAECSWLLGGLGKRAGRLTR